MTEVVVDHAEDAAVPVRACSRRTCRASSRAGGRLVKAFAELSDFKARRARCWWSPTPRAASTGCCSAWATGPTTWRLPRPGGQAAGRRLPHRLGPAGDGPRTRSPWPSPWGATASTVTRRAASEQPRLVAAEGVDVAEVPQHRPRLRPGPRHGQHPAQRHGPAADRDHRPRDRRAVRRARSR